MRVFQITIFLVSLFLGAAWAEPGSHLQPGDPLPGIQELDQSGQLRSFEELLGPKGAVLVVFRSADW